MLSSKKIAFFQLRLKKHRPSEIIAIGLQVKKICQIYNCQLVINDQPAIAQALNINYQHLGAKDLPLAKLAQLSRQKFKFGISCYDNLKRAKLAQRYGASYVSFGAFFKSPTKKTSFTPNKTILREWQSLANLKTKNCAIGGINADNYLELKPYQPDIIALSSYFWQANNPQARLKQLTNLLK